MSFSEKPDYFKLASEESGLTLKSSSRNKSASLAEAKDQHGDVIASQIFGEVSAPNCSYEVKKDINLSTLKLGQISVEDGKSFVLSSISVNTSPATVPTLEVSGEQVEDGAAAGTTIEIPKINLSKWHDAQIFAEAFTLTGEGCYLNGCSYSFACDVTKGTVNGEIVSHDVSNGRIECQVSIVQSGTAEPSIVCGEGWEMTAPLTNDNPDADYPTWSCTVRKVLKSEHTA